MVREAYYREWEDELVTNRHQDYRLPEGYAWEQKDPGFPFLSAIFYKIARLIGMLYCRAVLRVTVKNKAAIRSQKGGCFLYANHTQPVGDAFLPALVCGKRRCFTVAGQANFGLPVIGRLLPALGAIPVPEGMAQMRGFWRTVLRRAKEGGCVAIYPEAHVWPYYTKIRPFPATSFCFPAESGLPAFALTVTYQRRRLGARPKLTAYVDGPFWPDASLGRKERQRKLCGEVRACMERRSGRSTYEYIRYRKLR